MRSGLRCLRLPDVASDRAVSDSPLDTLAPSSLSTDSVDGLSSSTERTLEDPLEESWLDRREKRRDKRRRVELRPSGSPPSGAGLGGRDASGLLRGVLYQEV